jgi:hypothetical protein
MSPWRSSEQKESKSGRLELWLTGGEWRWPKSRAEPMQEEGGKGSETLHSSRLGMGSGDDRR